MYNENDKSPEAIVEAPAVPLWPSHLLLQSLTVGAHKPAVFSLMNRRYCEWTYCLSVWLSCVILQILQTSQSLQTIVCSIHHSLLPLQHSTKLEMITWCYAWVCLNVCVYVYLYVCMWVCVWVSVSVCVWVWVFMPRQPAGWRVSIVLPTQGMRPLLSWGRRRIYQRPVKLRTCLALNSCD